MRQIIFLIVIILVYFIEQSECKCIPEKCEFGCCVNGDYCGNLIECNTEKGLIWLGTEILEWIISTIFFVLCIFGVGMCFRGRFQPTRAQDLLIVREGIQSGHIRADNSRFVQLANPVNPNDETLGGLIQVGKPYEEKSDKKL